VAAVCVAGLATARLSRQRPRTPPCAPISSKRLAVLLDQAEVVADHAAALASVTPAMLKVDPCAATIASSASQLTERTLIGA